MGIDRSNAEAQDTPALKYCTKIGDRERVFTFERRGGELFVQCDGREVRLDLSAIGTGTEFSMLVDGRSHDVAFEVVDGRMRVLLHGESVKVHVEDEREHAALAAGSAKSVGRRTVKSSMPGAVIEVLVRVHDEVEDGQTLLVLEAMKMQNPLVAEGAGTVTKIHVKQGDTIASGTALLDLE